MNDVVVSGLPKSYNLLVEKCHEIGFTMPSDLYIGSLLKTLISSKPGSNLLEVGTGIGLSLSWMIDGMDVSSKGMYVIDDMIAQPNWPEGHQALVHELIDKLENHDDLQLTKLNWSTGIIIAVKKQ